MKRCIALFTILALAINIAGCKGKTKYTDHFFECFDTVTTVIGYEYSKKDFDEVCGDIKNLLTEYHGLFDIYNEYDGINNIYSINSSDSPIKADAKIIDLLEFAKDMHTLSDGKVNVAMGSVLSLWHQYREEGTSIPPKHLLEEAGKHTDINNVIIDKTAGTVFLADEKMSLDVGAVAKGYALEKVAEYLENKGVTGYLINVGGNVRAIGNKGDNLPWNVGIENPDQTSSQAYVDEVRLVDKAVATSGNYQRYHTVNGKNYHHIIDEKTLMPGENFTAVSVVCDDAGMADGLSTALFLMTYDEGKKLADNLGLDKVVWVFPDGSVKKF